MFIIKSLGVQFIFKVLFTVPILEFVHLISYQCINMVFLSSSYTM